MTESPKFLTMKRWYAEDCRGTLYGPAKYLTKRQQKYRMMNCQELEVYSEKVKASRGYDVDGCSGCLPGGIVNVKEDSSNPYWRDALKSAKYATKQYGEDNNRSFKFVRLDKANVQPVNGFLYYLTFTAKDSTDRTCKSYRARVWDHVLEGKMQLKEMEEYKRPDNPPSKDDGTSAAGNSNKRPRRPGKEVGSTSSVNTQVLSPSKKCRRVEPDVGKMPRRHANEVGSTSSKAKKSVASQVMSPSKKGQRVKANLGGRYNGQGQALAGFSVLLQQVKNDKGGMTHALARNLASEKWKLLSPDERRNYTSMAISQRV